MPIYEYICDACKKRFEERVSKFEPLKRCPFCDDPNLRQKFSPPNPRYKGAGFYTTESRGITGRKRKPKIKVGTISDFPLEEQARIKEQNG